MFFADLSIKSEKELSDRNLFKAYGEFFLSFLLQAFFISNLSLEESFSDSNDGLSLTMTMNSKIFDRSLTGGM